MELTGPRSSLPLAPQAVTGDDAEVPSTEDSLNSNRSSISTSPTPRLGLMAVGYQPLGVKRLGRCTLSKACSLGGALLGFLALGYTAFGLVHNPDSFAHPFSDRGHISSSPAPAPLGEPEVSEWSVIVEGTVNVRSETSLTAPVTRLLITGEIFLAQQLTDDWVRLQGDTNGNVRIHFKGLKLIERRDVTYVLLKNSSCEADGYIPIRQPDICSWAMRSLQVPEDPKTRALGVGGEWPTGCQHQVANSMWHLCSNLQYPSSTSTMTTTSTTTSTLAGLSLFCFSLMVPNSAEEGLVKTQCEEHVGIFQCDHWAVLSTERRWIGTDNSGKDIWSMVNKAPEAKMGIWGNPGVTTNSWLNTAIFIQAYDNLIVNSPEILKAGWVIKADPDAVFFPERLRRHVMPFMGKTVFLLNCRNHYGPHLYGALEVMSKGAMTVYKDGVHRCKTELHWQGWGEDSYVEKCLLLLGVAPIKDFTLVGDDRCMPATCKDKYRAAFHPYKTKDQWMTCMKESLVG